MLGAAYGKVPVMAGLGTALTVTVVVPVAVQPPVALVTVTNKYPLQQLWQPQYLAFRLLM